MEGGFSYVSLNFPSFLTYPLVSLTSLSATPLPTLTDPYTQLTILADNHPRPFHRHRRHHHAHGHPHHHNRHPPLYNTHLYPHHLLYFHLLILILILILIHNLLRLRYQRPKNSLRLRLVDDNAQCKSRCATVFTCESYFDSKRNYDCTANRECRGLHGRICTVCWRGSEPQGRRRFNVALGNWDRESHMRCWDLVMAFFWSGRI